MLPGLPGRDFLKNSSHIAIAAGARSELWGPQWCTERSSASVRGTFTCLLLSLKVMMAPAVLSLMVMRKKEKFLPFPGLIF